MLYIFFYYKRKALRRVENGMPWISTCLGRRNPHNSASTCVRLRADSQCCDDYRSGADAEFHPEPLTASLVQLRSAVWTGDRLGERNLFVTGPGPASGGSKPGKDTRAHMPEKSGVDAALCVPAPVGQTERAGVCPKAGVAAAAANKKRNPAAASPRSIKVRMLRRFIVFAPFTFTDSGLRTACGSTRRPCRSRRVGTNVDSG
jgi:hypothetical protein